MIDLDKFKIHIFELIFKKVGWFENEGVLHIEKSTSGYSGHWIAHPFCNKRLKNWVGFDEINYARTGIICDKCLKAYLKSLLVVVGKSKEASEQ